MTANVKCPTCGKQVPWSSDNRWRPFCCERCRLIDLGAWASEAHVIAGSTEVQWDESGDEMIRAGSDESHN